ncbi:MAG: AmmeMemoRadiSam system radical SAM enzyme [Candidatus Omnitrophica bacterium]|nr:AmmeMemoRadiSam system radical SAM enzyme [Candidatus Omnitrophota bacterium]MDD5351708.1 AmmeMemoRadiSam system radical SAM enzyme [Candidatus Omnitrophota bacterium]MDD5550918.1 AmmeMemoRadiSam system radical SAM enzyme [Candidatus Omnitrophota bacterium]
MKWNLFNKQMSRRQFCKLCLYSGATMAVSPLIMDLFNTSVQANENNAGMGFINTKEAMYYEKIDEKTIQCHLCPRNCVLSDGMRGFCRAREPKGGKHYSLVYGNPTAVHVDPIEKKPLFHFLPATTAFSIATAGCNFRCKYCQNWQISQYGPEETVNDYMPPEDVARQAKSYNCPTIAYTYTEPSIFYEYMLDTAKIAKIQGIRNMYHSNGSLNPEPAEELSLYLDAADIDLKGFTQEFYSSVCEGYLEAVLNTLKILKKNKVWLEITNLVIPTLNDDFGEIREMCVWIKENLGPDTPVHFSRFVPQYKLTNLYATPVSTIEKAREIAMAAGLNFVYIGNVPGNLAESTYCPKCKKPVIRRVGYAVLEINLDSQGRSKCCGYPIPGVWS